MMMDEACGMAAMKYGNNVLLNKSTDGVAYKIQFNRTPTFHNLTVVRNTCICMIQITIRRTAEVRLLVVHQLHQSEILWLIHGCSKWRMLQNIFIALRIGLAKPLSCAWHHQKLYQNCLAASLTMLGTVRA